MALSIFDEINAKITGRLALMTAEEADALSALVAIPGDHVEIGCLWGGTAILAALAKQQAGQPGHVYTIDFMRGGYWDNGDPSCKLAKPSPAAILDNLARFGVAHRVSVLKCSSHPWPLPAEIAPASVLIDGDHRYEGILQDWQNVKALKPQFVAFHDYNAKTHPGVARVVDEVVSKDRKYKRLLVAGTLVVYQCRQ